jgi:hypothetical protein
LFFGMQLVCMGWLLWQLTHPHAHLLVWAGCCDN